MPERNQPQPGPSARRGSAKPPESAYDRALSRANDALDTTMEGARDWGRRAAEGAEANPLAVLIGGVAMGVLAGLVAPRGDRERELLAPLGQRINDSVTAAVAAAKEAGREELGQFGLGSNPTGTPGKRLLEGVLGSIGSAAAAAAKAPGEARSGQQ